MYAARRRQRSVQWKFQFGKLCRGAFLLFIQKPRQFLEADAVHIMR